MENFSLIKTANLHWPELTYERWKETYQTLHRWTQIIGKVRLTKVTFHPVLHEFILPYEAVKNALKPNDFLLEFFQSTYEAAANLGRWDRALLEESPYLETLQNRAETKKAA